MWGNLETMKQSCSVTFSPHSLSGCGCSSLCWHSHPSLPPTFPQVRALNRLEAGTSISTGAFNWSPGRGSEGGGGAWSAQPSPAVAQERGIFCFADPSEGHNA